MIIMKYYSTNGKAPEASLSEAVIKGLAPDKGLYMPEEIRPIAPEFYNSFENLTLQQIAYEAASKLFGDDIDADSLSEIVNSTLQFDIPLKQVEPNIFALELFHGPTLAFKDVGARFMARLLRYFLKQQGCDKVNVLVATSGDTGSAVANGFLGVEGIHVYVLYPKGKVSNIQESQFTTLGQNITAIQVDGVFDDCQALVKQAFMDSELNAHMKLTSANSINIARFLPQSFYYFYAVAQLKKLTGKSADELRKQVVFCVPSGNFGNITAGLFAWRMGLPVNHFIAANNANDVFYKYLQTGIYKAMPSIQTLANAMDVGAPSNFDRILKLYHNDWTAIKNDISGATYTDEQIAHTMQQCYKATGYVLDPHGACGYQALKDLLPDGKTGIFLETAHPAKFKEKVDHILGTDIAIPERLRKFISGKKQSVAMSKNFADFKQFLLQQ